MLLAKGKIKQSPPVKRKLHIIDAPQKDLTVEKTPTLAEFEEQQNVKAENAAKEERTDRKDAPENFSGPNQGYPFYGYPFGFPYPYGQPQGGKDGYQMPPIVQPVAFVPYVTQEQPLMQYSPAVEEPVPQPTPQPAPQPQPVQQSQRPVQTNQKFRKN